MAVTATLDEVKVVMGFTKGSQTIGKCNKTATDEQLWTLGKAISSLNEEELETIMKVQESILVDEA